MTIQISPLGAAVSGQARLDAARQLHIERLKSENKRLTDLVEEMKGALKASLAYDAAVERYEALRVLNNLYEDWLRKTKAALEKAENKPIEE